MWQHTSAFPSVTPHLPPHCEPTSVFLFKVSSFFHACIPTPLALLSTVLGFLSIGCWLFAQLPQIFKNYRLRSTSGLSIFFLVEWCLGDLSNFVGAIMTEQATWQVLVGAYYCFVDVVLVAQWTWFEGMGKGRQIKAVWKSADEEYEAGKRGGSGGGYNQASMLQVPKTDAQTSPKALQIPTSPFKDDLFSTPNYGSIASSDTETAASSTPQQGSKRSMPRLNTHSFPSPSPRTTLFLTLLVALATANASPSPTRAAPPLQTHSHASAIGTAISWFSTALYLLSRLPQLLKNFSRRSTAGLSPLLFLAAFFGNLFYSSSMLCNPSLWEDFAPYGGGGWAGAHGSRRVEWMVRSLPFFLGAAGVLVMDASVGVQFWLWSEKEVVFVGEGAGDGAGAPGARPRPERLSTNSVKGWMRGWVPTASLSRLRLSATWSSRSSSTTTLAAQGRGSVERGEQERLIGSSTAR